MNKYIILKEQIIGGERKLSAFTSLTMALDSENIKTDPIYNAALYNFSLSRPFSYGNITFRRIKLNHYQWKMKSPTGLKTHP